jgi:DNA-binding SARP family transcriptional activator
VTGPDGPIALPTRKVAALLAYLALEPGRHSREQLAALCRGDVPDAQARTSLRTALAVLRRQLAPALLRTERLTVQRNPAFPLWVDALAFQAQASAFLAGHTPAVPDLDLYGGDLLADFYDEWIFPIRAAYQRLYLQTLRTLLTTLRAQSQYRALAACAERLLALDPTDETAYQHLMFSHLVLGERQQALQVYMRCAQALATELGCAPHPTTQALYQRIQRLSLAPAMEAAALTNLPVPHTTFIGQATTLAVREIENVRGERDDWLGEAVVVPRRFVRDIQQRRMSVGGTGLLGGAIAAGLVAATAAMGSGVFEGGGSSAGGAAR